MTPPAGSPEARLLTVGAGILSLLIVVSTLAAVFHNYHPIPFNDSWETLDLYRKYLDGTLGIGDLLAQHYEHRIFFSRLLILLDFRIDAGTGRLLIVLMLLLQALHALLMDAALKRQAGLSGAERFFFLALAFAFFFWLKQRENFVWGFQIVWMINGLSATLGAFLIAGIRPDARTPARWVRLAGAALCCVVCAYSLANGIFLGIVLLAVLWKGRPSRAVLFLWAAFCAVLAAFYLWGYRSPPQHASPLDMFQWKTLHYAAMYLGNPVAGSGMRMIAGTVLGLLGLAWSGGFAWKFFRDKAPSFHAKFAFAGTAYVVMTAIATAAGRHNTGVEQAASNRYLAAVMVFWLLLLTRAYLHAGTGSSRGKWILRGTAVLLALYFLPVQAEMAKRMQGFHLRLDEGALALMSGVNDSAAIAVPDQRGIRTWERNDFMKRNRLSVYREDWPRMLGEVLAADAGAESGPPLKGALEEARFVPSASREGFFLRGRVFPERGEAPPEVILFTRGDTVFGFAKTGGRSCRGCFTGYARGSADAEFGMFAPERGRPERVREIMASPNP